MVNPTPIQAQYEIPEEIREQIKADFTQNDFLEESNARSDLQTIYNNCAGNPEKKDELLLLWGISKQATMVNDTRPEDMRIKEGNDGKLYLMLKNFSSSGINFTIQDGKSLIFEAEGLSPEKRKELARFFYDMGFDNFKFPETREGREYAHDFEEIKEQNRNVVAEVTSGRPRDEDGLSTQATEVSVKKFKSSLVAQLQVGDFKERNMRMINTGDGYLICCYNNEADMNADGKVDKDMIMKHTKAFAAKIYRHKGKTCCEYYLPDGKEMDGNKAKMILKAAKAAGSVYFDLTGGGIEHTGKGMGAFWEAAGKTLMVPRASCGMAAKDVVAMLEAAKKENHTRKDLLRWKRLLAEELQEAEDKARDKKDGPLIKKFEQGVANGGIKLESYRDEFQLAQQDGTTAIGSLKEYAQSAYLKENGGYENSDMDNQISSLLGFAKYERFANEYITCITRDIIDKNINEKDDSKRWDVVEVCAAYQTLGQMIADFGDEASGLNLNTRNDSAQKTHLMEEFKKRMELEKVEVAKTLISNIDSDKGNKNAKNSAVTKTQQNAKQAMTDAISDVEVLNGVKISTNVKSNKGDPFNEEKYRAIIEGARPMPRTFSAPRPISPPQSTR